MAPPSGTVTLLFTDIEGSTRLLERIGGERYARLLADHHGLVRGVVAAQGGYEVDTEGDAFFVTFASARAAVAAAADAQRALAAHAWPDDVRVRVRMGLHTGEPLVAGSGYVGMDVHRAARVMSAGHGGQVLLSQATRDLVAPNMPGGVTLRDLGEHRLKDLTLPQRLYQLAVEGLESDFPPPKTLENRPTNLPAQPTPLIGRTRELADLGALLGREDVRLVTLTGPGGTGKTRLALQAAAELVERYPDGVWFVNLAPLSDSALVVGAVAQTLAVGEEAGRPLAETLAEHLRNRQLLLVIDNFEHVLSAALELAVLMRESPHLKILATSRAPLHLSGEHEFSVPPLSLPSPQRVSIESLPHFEAVALFLERAQAARRDFAVTTENAPAIAEICARLDGLPLAIELAAARVKLLPPAALLGRLDQRLKLLTGGARDVEERQQTLRAAIDWSYRLLDDRQRVLFDRMAVFAGGRTLEALEAVCDPDGELDVLEGLAALVDNNLVRQEEGPDGEPRFVMLETIHEYAREQLAGRTDAHVVHRRHAEYFRELVRTALADRTNRWQTAPPLEAEQGNFRAALTWAEAADRPLGARLAAELYRFWDFRGHIAEGQDWLRRFSDATDAADIRARLLAGLGALGLTAGDLDEAAACLATSRRLVETLDDDAQLSSVLSNEALVLIELKRYGEARERLERACRLDEQRGAADEGARAKANLGYLALLTGNHASAMAAFAEAQAFFDRVGDREGLCVSLENLGIASLLAGSLDDARSYLGRSIALASEIGYRQLVLYGLVALAAVEAAAHDVERAARLAGAADGIGAATGVSLETLERQLLDDLDATLLAHENAAHLGSVRAAAHAWSDEEAVRYALDGSSGAG